MIVAAGRGVRLRPLTDLRPKPALPVRGIPLIAFQLALLARHGVSEVVINVHHLPERLEEVARSHCPPGMELRFSRETELLDTGGGIRRVAEFLRESDPCLLVGGDMLLDADLSRLVAHHRERADSFTMLLCDDPRIASFGSVGIAADGRVRRIGSRFDLGGEARRGLYVWANVMAARAFDSMPDREVFSHLLDWLAPRLAAGATDVIGEVWPVSQCSWTPVGTPEEYLAANLVPPELSYLDIRARSRSLGVHCEGDVILGAGASLGPGASLRRAVVWDGEQVIGGLEGSDGVYAGGAFHPCLREGATHP